MNPSSDPPFEEAADVRRARASARKLAASPLAFSVLGEPGTGRATLALELADVRRERLGARAWTRVRGSVATPLDVAALVRANATPEIPVVAVVDGIEVIDGHGQLALASLIRERKLAAIFVGSPDPKDAEHPAGMLPELHAVASAAVTLPPLRDRGEDVVRWAELLLGRAADEVRKAEARLTPDAFAAIRAHGWPGNLWELDGRLRKALALAEGTAIGARDLDLAGPREASPLKSLAEAIEEFKAEYVAMALARCSGNRTQAARVLGVDARTVFRYLDKTKQPT